MQTILGSGGSIGAELAKILPEYTDKIRLVSRNPQRVNPSDELHPADLSDPQQVDAAVEGSEVVYLVVGFKYDIKVWRKTWPPLTRAVIDACRKHGAKLVFFDNLYLYDRNHMDPLTEETPIRPTSKKGEVRAEVARMLHDEMIKGQLQVLVARAPDFIGPKNSVLMEMVYKPMSQGGKGNWLVDAHKVHSFIYTKDAARATAILGNTPDAYGQVWHLPTSNARLTGAEWVKLIGKVLNVKGGYRILPKWLLRLSGVFVPFLRELAEMAYQYDRDYFFDSSKFTKRFKYTPATPEEAVKATIEQMKKE